MTTVTAGRFLPTWPTNYQILCSPALPRLAARLTSAPLSFPRQQCALRRDFSSLRPLLRGIRMVAPPPKVDLKTLKIPEYHKPPRSPSKSSPAGKTGKAGKNASPAKFAGRGKDIQQHWQQHWQHPVLAATTVSRTSASSQELGNGSPAVDSTTTEQRSSTIPTATLLPPPITSSSNSAIVSPPPSSSSSTILATAIPQTHAKHELPPEQTSPTASAESAAFMGDSAPIPRTTSHHVPSSSSVVSSSNNSEGTLLYQAPSYNAFKCWTTTTTAFLWGLATYYTYTYVMFPPPGLPSWVTYMYLFSGIAMSGMGTWTYLGGQRLVKHIRAVPSSLVSRSGAGKTAAIDTAAAQKAEAAVVLEVAVDGLHRFKPKLIYVAPSDVKLKAHALRRDTENIKMAALFRDARHTEQRRQLEGLYATGFKSLKHQLAGSYRAFGRVLTQDGFAVLQIEGKNYKLDVTGGYVLQGGNVMDRLLASPRA